MKYQYPILFFFITLFSIGIVNAQNGPELTLKTPKSKIVIDGDIREWGDSLTYYSPEERLNYMIANSKDTLYLAVKIYDNTEIARVLNAGLTFSIDPRGKKKETFSITYPLNTGGGQSLYGHKIDEAEGVTQEDRDELMKEKITTLRGIKVVGFNKDIEDDMITTSNTYGIQSSLNYDEVGNLVYEEAIPLKFFHTDLSSKNDWAFNIKINAIPRPTPGSESGENGGGHHGGGGGGMGGGGMGGRGGGGHRGGGGGGNNPSIPSETSKSVDFWGKFHLAQ
jgi:uncharacterized membrane protein YgcG